MALILMVKQNECDSTGSWPLLTIYGNFFEDLLQTKVKNRYLLIAPTNKFTGRTACFLFQVFLKRTESARLPRDHSRATIRADTTNPLPHNGHYTMNITDHISKAANSRNEYDKAFSEIVEAIRSEIRQYIAAKYPKGMSGLPSVTDIVQQTLDKLQQNMRDRSDTFLDMSTKEFVVLVKRIAHNQLRDAKKSKAVKLPTVGDSKLPHTGLSNDSPEDKASNKEISLIILSSLVAEADPTEALVCILGLGLNFSPRDIEKSLPRDDDGSPVFSDSKILRLLDKARTRVLRKLKELGEEGIDPFTVE